MQPSLQSLATPLTMMDNGFLVVHQQTFLENTLMIYGKMTRDNTLEYCVTVNHIVLFLASLPEKIDMPNIDIK